MQQISDLEYRALADRLAPKSKCLKNCVKAFVIGGLICVLGQGIRNFWLTVSAGEKAAGTLTSVTLIFFSALLTGLSVYDDLAKHGGAGTLVPITGFANAITAPAVEFKTEGLVTGLAVKMFTIAGPVLVYGLSASVLYGFVFWIWMCA
jgi:stage V sporulation protein AC